MDNYNPAHWGTSGRGKKTKMTPKLKLLNELTNYVNNIVFSLNPRYIDSSFLQAEGKAYAIHFIDELIPEYEVQWWQEAQAKNSFPDLCERHLKHMNENHRLALKTKELLNMEINNERT